MHLNFAVDLDQAQARGLTNKDVEDVKRLMKDVVVLALAVRPERRGMARDRLVDLLVGDVALPSSTVCAAESVLFLAKDKRLRLIRKTFVVARFDFLDITFHC